MGEGIGRANKYRCSVANENIFVICLTKVPSHGKIKKMIGYILVNDSCQKNWNQSPVDKGVREP